MMSSKIMVASLLVLLAFLTATEGRSLGVELHCRCIQKESRRIPNNLIASLEIIPANSHCQESEIIASLKNANEKICLEPQAVWVQRLIKRITSNKKR